PDGKRIAFTSLRDGHLQIYTINLEDNNVHRLTDTNRDEFARQPAWSPFGNQIAYSIRRYSAYQIWVMTDTGQSSEQITRSGYTFWDILPVWSPDGTAILYNQHSSGNTSRTWLMSIDYENRGGEGVDVDATPLPVRDVDYSEDGLLLAFEGKDGNNRDIYLMTASGDSRTRLTTDPGNDIDPAWRPLP
ncbi:MAG: PD40 domain-containing protein, partial [Anaerolineae bacterium]|nr:PD40 domain-containing protein [Anaerolineae bacterium]